MRNTFHTSGTLFLSILLFTISGILSPKGIAQEAADKSPKEAIAKLKGDLESAKGASSDARKRLAVRRAIREAEELVVSLKDSPDRFPVLEFLFRAQQQLIAIDNDAEHRKALIETCRELVKAPDEFADLRLEADLLLSQADLAKQGADTEARAKALRPFINRYLETPVAAKVIRLAMVMALELGDSKLVADLQEIIEERFAGDLEMIAFQRDKLGGQVFGAPFTGTYKRSDGKVVRFPMEGLGRSTLLFFWSKENDGMNVLKGLAKAAIENRDMLAGRLEIISFNLDELPDAGESIVRGLGVDWQVLHLPEGRKNPIYDAYVRTDPRMLTVSPTGNTALIMAGTTRQKEDAGGEPDYGRMFGSSLAREWTDQRYVAQLASLFAGDFLVLDPEGGLDPARPPELKALAKGGGVEPLARGAASIPDETLRKIQACFVAPPLRYRLPHAEARACYEKAVGLCRTAMSEHAGAPDLWIVRNRLIVALLGLWKSDADLGQLEAAIAEAKAGMSAGYPSGCDVVPRFCLAREALLDPAADPASVIRRMVADCGGENASGPALAAACLLALDVADRRTFEGFRKAILKDHTEYPAMWTFTSFLLDRHHTYWLFQVPFTAGWSYGRRQGYFQTKGDAEESHRQLHTELGTTEGKTIRIPSDLDKEWTAIIFCQPPPWSSKRDDGLPPSPARLLQPLCEFSTARPAKDMKVILATLGGDPAAARSQLETSKVKLECEVATLPGGIANPLIQRLGILSEDTEFNGVLIRKDGGIAVMVSGLAQLGRNGSTLGNVIMSADEQAVTAALEKGDVDAAKTRILSLAPPFDPEAVDQRGRKLKAPEYSLAHLRSRARVYMALKEWDKALADAQEVVQRQLGTDGGMSLRTDELDASEALRDEILAKMKPGGN